MESGAEGEALVESLLSIVRDVPVEELRHVVALAQLHKDQLAKSERLPLKTVALCCTHCAQEIEGRRRRPSLALRSAADSPSLRALSPAKRGEWHRAKREAERGSAPSPI